MKVIVLHGEDTVKSFDRLKKLYLLQKKDVGNVYIDESNLSFTETLSATPFFGAEDFMCLRI